MIKTDKRDIPRLQLYFTSIKDEILAPPCDGIKVHNANVRTNNLEKGKNDKIEMPEWMKVGQKVEVRPYHKNKKPKIMTIRTIEWPYLVTFEELPIGGCNPRRILGPHPPIPNPDFALDSGIES